MPIINSLADAVNYLNTLYEGNSTPPIDGDEDYEVWTNLLNIAIDIWENEEGCLWKELFVTLDSATTGDKTIVASDFDYNCPTDFKFLVGFVRTTKGGTQTYYKVIQSTDLNIYANDDGNWCYITGNKATGFDLHFNPKCTLDVGATIKYEYYKYANSMSVASGVFEMADPMFAVYYALGELKKDEGDTTGLNVATQKLESMKTLNNMTSWYETNDFISPTDIGFNA